MHITVLTVGTRGDVQPFVALGSRLQSEGHSVRIGTHGVHGDLVRGYDLEFAQTEGNPQDLMRSRTGQHWIGSGQNPIKFWREFYRLVNENVSKGLADAASACAGTDAIIFTFFGSAGLHIAEQLKVPSIFALLQPFTRTRAFPVPQIPPLLPGGLYNRFTYTLAEQMAWQLGRRWINRWRTGSLGLEPLSLRGPMNTLYTSRHTYLYGFSEHVIPRPADWPESHYISGYWFLNQDPDWTPSEELAAFLASGPPPLYLGFGSMAGAMAKDLLALSLKAVELAGHRAILLGDWAEADELPPSDRVLFLRSAPHDWLFPRVAAVVHHGGAGTTAAGLRAGKPTLVVPFFADQPFWGRRIQALGVGPAPLPPKRLTPERLAHALDRIVSDEGMRARAAALGERIRQEDGVGRATEIVLRCFSG